MKQAQFLIILLLLSLTPELISQPGNTELMNTINEVEKNFSTLDHRLDVIEKKIDDVYWYNKVGDIAFIDKVYITGPPLAREVNPTAQGAGNPVKFWNYIFFSRSVD